MNEAFDNVGAVLKFYKEKFSWISIDNKNAKVISSVHFGKAYENACKDNPRANCTAIVFANKSSLGPLYPPDGLWRWW